MDSCLMCPEGTKCRGVVLHGLVLALLDAVADGAGADAVAKQISREDARLLEEYGRQARRTCWSKALVMAVARRVTYFVAQGLEGDDLRMAVERLVEGVHALASRLPNGVRVEVADLAAEIYNLAADGVHGHGASYLVPANIVAQACQTVLSRRRLPTG